VYNAANEECVESFRDGRLPFLGIVDTIARVVSEHEAPAAVTLEDVLAADDWARRRARELT
jgi:1-deoxy-D-xylulose-5-phosphate reductoisomerase